MAIVYINHLYYLIYKIPVSRCLLPSPLKRLDWFEILWTCRIDRRIGQHLFFIYLSDKCKINTPKCFFLTFFFTYGRMFERVNLKKYWPDLKKNFQSWVAQLSKKCIYHHTTTQRRGVLIKNGAKIIPLERLRYVRN